MTNMWGTAICQPMRTDIPSCFALEASAGRSLSCGMCGLETERGKVVEPVGRCCKGRWLRKRCGNLRVKNAHGDPRGRIEELRFARTSRTSDRTRCCRCPKVRTHNKAAYDLTTYWYYLDLWALWVLPCIPVVVRLPTLFFPQTQLQEKG